jgi:hypothetical protein
MGIGGSLTVPWKETKLLVKGLTNKQDHDIQMVA